MFQFKPCGIHILRVYFNIAFSLLLCHGQTQTIWRDTPNNPNSANKVTIECSQTIVNSPYPDGCEVHCSRTAACGSSLSDAAPTILCPPQSKCVIHCEGLQSCRNADIMVNASYTAPRLPIVLICSGAQSCENTTIHAPKQSNISVLCDNAPFGNYECQSLTIHGSAADNVHLQCDGAYCNNMDIYCPHSVSTSSRNCLIDCESKSPTKCNNNNIYIASNNLNDEDVGVSYECSTTKQECTDSSIFCDYENGAYEQRCKWTKFSVNDQLQWNCHEEDMCHGDTALGFLTDWHSASTIVFVSLMGFGMIIILFIFMYSMKEKYDEWGLMKEEQRKRSKIKKQSKKRQQKKAKLMKGHHLHGSYYRPKKRELTQTQSETDSRTDPFDVYIPKSIGIIEEDDESQYGVIEEEEPSFSFHSERSRTDSVPSKTKKKNKSKKQKKKKKPQHVESEHKYDNDPVPIMILPLDAQDEAVQIHIKTEKKKGKKNPKKKSSKKKKTKNPRLDGYRSHSEDSVPSMLSTASTKSTKSNKSIKSPRSRAKSPSTKSNKSIKSPRSRTNSPSTRSAKSNKIKSSTKSGKKKNSLPPETTLQASQSFDGNVTKKTRKKKIVRFNPTTPTKTRPKSKSKKDTVAMAKLSKSKSAPEKKASKVSTKAKKRKQSAPLNQAKGKTKKKKKKGAPVKAKSEVAVHTVKQQPNHDQDDDGGSLASSVFGIFSPRKAKTPKRPTLKNTKSSPLYTKNKLNTSCSDVMWGMFYASQVYGGALFHAWDIATDIGVIINWWENDEAFELILLSSFCVFFYRFLSAIVLWRQFGWVWGIIQFLDLTIYIEAYRSLKNQWCQYTREFNWIRRMEAIFESSPQALIQLGYLLKSPEFNKNYKQNDFQLFDILIILSFASSLSSIAFSVARDDEVNVELHAMPFMVPYFRNKKKRAKHYKKVAEAATAKKKKKNQSYVKERKSEEKRKRKESETMLALYELDNCYNKDVEYEADSVNTIWLPNWKYLVRFLFRFAEATARILTLTLFWVAFGGPFVGGLLGFSLMLYSLLQIAGIIGYEWGNMVSFVVVHPNLTLKTNLDMQNNDIPGLSRIAYKVCGWHLLHETFQFDMVLTHFIHRLLETVAHLVAITIAIYGFNCCGVIEKDELGNTHNTKEVFHSSFGYSIVAAAAVFTILTPLLYKFVISNWVKKGASLENNLFGLIKSWDKKLVVNFLKKSNRTDHLINKVSNGFTPLGLACEIGFYDVLTDLIEYGANINEPNKRGETPVFIFAKQKTLTKHTRGGLNKLKELDADFSVVDEDGFSPAFRACQQGNVKFLLWLVKNEMSEALEAKDFSNRSIAHIAALQNQHTLLRKLAKKLNHRKMFKERDEYGRIPLHYAFLHQSADAVMYLMDDNRDASKEEDESGDTPLIYGARYGDASFFNELKRLNYTKFRDFLIPVAIEGEVDTMKWLLRECQGTSGKRKPLEKFVDKESQRSPLHFAAMHGNHSLLKLLVKYKFGVNDTDHKHRTPAFFAAQRNHLECLKVLAKYKADFRIANTRHMTPYAVAQHNEHHLCVAYLSHHEH